VIDLDLFALAGPSQETGRIYGVVIGVVTETDGLGRVKLKFPWLSEEVESNWARVISPMAGNDRGLYVMPAPGDEVLVAFEHGCVECPYVLGSLWNGKDLPPVGNGNPPADDDDSKDVNKVRVLKSRRGHVVRLDDTKGGEKIEIIDAKGKQSIVFDTAASTLTLTADQDVVIESKSGLLKLSGKKGVEITASEGAGKLESKQNLDIKSSGQVNVKGSVINLN
jgi:uncharacterized protein involved in type VI secretion and phage assembly